MSEFKVCKVINIDDEHGQGLIQAFYVPTDGIYRHKKKDSDYSVSSMDGFVYDLDKIKWCAPLLPRVFGVTPKVGENVIVTEFSGQRWYIGPIYGQLTNLDDATGEDATSFMPGSNCSPPSNPENNENIVGALPEQDDVAINGKGETGLYLKEFDAVLHAGIKVVGGKTKLQRNRKGDEAFLQLSHSGIFGHPSTATLVADKINLFGNKPSTGNPDFNDKIELMHKAATSIICEDDMEILMNSAKSVPYGENLVNILFKIIVALFNHVHPIGNKVPIVENTELARLTQYLTEREADAEEKHISNNGKKYDFDAENITLANELLSPNVKIN